ncbi:MAG TPA: DUF3618 domain-containing protein [Stellaceae bacterium]|nr:DUF3618 domain-containing protein [Stellaceae bacterium]
MKSARTPEEIEDEILETRARLDAIITALERKLSPRQLMERGVDMLKENMGAKGAEAEEDFRVMLADLARRNPLPLALIGVGVGWLLLGSGRVTDRLAAKASDIKEGLTYSTGSGGHAHARVKPAALLEKAREAVTGADRHAIDFRSMGDRVTAFVGDHPLAVGALGMLAGAALAFLSLEAWPRRKVTPQTLDKKETLDKKAEHRPAAALQEDLNPQPG